MNKDLSFWFSQDSGLSIPFEAIWSNKRNSHDLSLDSHQNIYTTNQTHLNKSELVSIIRDNAFTKLINNEPFYVSLHSSIKQLNKSKNKSKKKVDWDNGIVYYFIIPIKNPFCLAYPHFCPAHFKNPMLGELLHSISQKPSHITFNNLCHICCHNSNIKFGDYYLCSDCHKSLKNIVKFSLNSVIFERNGILCVYETLNDYDQSHPLFYMLYKAEYNHKKIMLLKRILIRYINIEDINTIILGIIHNHIRLYLQNAIDECNTYLCKKSVS